MVAPSGEGAVRCMKMSMQNLRNSKVDYVNTHGTSTPVGDTKEIEAMKEVFKDKVPPFSSTKSITGHSLGATSVQEDIIEYCDNNLKIIENLNKTIEGNKKIIKDIITSI